MKSFSVSRLVRILLGLAFFFVVADAAAQTYYVRQGASGNGSDWNNAFGSLPATLVRGATYFIADGSYPGYTFDDAESGTSVITLKKAIQGDHGTDTGWNSTYGDGQASFSGSLSFGRDYYLIDGQVRNESNWLSSGSYGIHAGSVYIQNLAIPPGGDHITVRYCDLGNPYSQTAVTTQEAVYLGGFAAVIRDIAISRCFLHNSSFIQAAIVDGITVEYTAFAAGWAKEAFRGQGTCKNGIIRHCLFYNSSQANPGEAGSGCTAEIAIWDDGSSGQSSFDNWQIYGNVIWNDKDIPHSGGVIVVGGNGSSWAGSSASNVKIYNNTVVGIRNSFITANILINGGSGNEVRNTLWYDCGGTPFASPNTSSNGEQTSNPFVNYSAFDWRLTRGIPGTALSSAYNTTLDGLVRGGDGVWDAGAFEFSGVADMTPPTITGVAALSITATSASISWTTEEASNSRVEYGTTTGYGSVANNPSMVTTHSVLLSGLVGGTLYHYRVTSADASGNTGMSGDFTFTTPAPDIVAPTVTLTAPTAGSTLQGNVTVIASATDNIAVVGVEFLLNGQTMGPDDTISPFSTSWNTTAMTDGQYTLQARARDAAGNLALSPTVSIRTQNGITNNLLNGLVGYWKFDEGSGIQATNTTGLSPSGSLQSGATWTSGLRNQALLLDGANGHVVVPDSADLRVNGSFTAAVWVRQTTSPQTSGLAFYLEKGSDDHDNYSFGIQGTSSGQKLFFEFEDAAGAFHHIQQSGTVLLGVNQWAHMAVVFDDANDTVRFYKNGVEVGRTAVTQSLSGNFSGHLYIGRENYPGFEWPMAGAMDELRIYRRALTTSEIETLFSALPPSTPTGLAVIQN